jgi:hypothetical protein
MAQSTALVKPASKACSKCKQVKELACFYTTGKKADGAAKYNSWCKPCIKDKQASYHKRTWGPEKLQFSAHRRTRSINQYLAYLLGKARQRKPEAVTITVEYLLQLWKTQEGLCALTGWPLTMELGKGKIVTNCSLDRIDSSKSYEFGNVQLVCLAANIAKSNLSQSDFINLCKAVGKIADAKV